MSLFIQLAIAIPLWLIAIALIGIWVDMPNRKFTMLQLLRQARALEWLASTSARDFGQPHDAMLEAMRRMAELDLDRIERRSKEEPHGE